MRSTVISERPQPLQTTSNTRLNSSGKSSPFCAHRLDVPVHLLAEIGKTPQDGTGWHQAFRQAQVAMGVRGEYFPCDPCREQPELRSALHTVAVVRLAKGGCQRATSEGSAVRRRLARMANSKQPNTETPRERRKRWPRSFRRFRIRSSLERVRT